MLTCIKSLRGLNSTYACYSDLERPSKTTKTMPIRDKTVVRSDLISQLDKKLLSSLLFVWAFGPLGLTIQWGRGWPGAPDPRFQCCPGASILLSFVVAQGKHHSAKAQAWHIWPTASTFKAVRGSGNSGNGVTCVPRTPAH